MLRKLTFLLGFGLGALFVWSLTHNARKHFARWTQQRENARPAANWVRMRLAEHSAVDGVDYLDDAYWDKEMSQYQDWIEAVERGDPDADRFIK